MFTLCPGWGVGVNSGCAGQGWRLAGLTSPPGHGGEIVAHKKAPLLQGLRRQHRSTLQQFQLVGLAFPLLGIGHCVFHLGDAGPDLSQFGVELQKYLLVLG